MHAENGRAGIELLKKNPGFDAVLMDIMMPEMDGYETMRPSGGCRSSARLPIIALTAKAMKGDREKCLEAGASDYVTKPVDLDQLFSVLRVWISASDDMDTSAGSTHGDRSVDVLLPLPAADDEAAARLRRSWTTTALPFSRATGRCSSSKTIWRSRASWWTMRATSGG